MAGLVISIIPPCSCSPFKIKIRHGYLNIKIEMDKFAILGPFGGPVMIPLHLSPLITQPKVESELHRVVLDLLWPHGIFINDRIPVNEYLG